MRNSLEKKHDGLGDQFKSKFTINGHLQCLLATCVTLIQPALTGLGEQRAKMGKWKIKEMKKVYSEYKDKTKHLESFQEKYPA